MPLRERLRRVFASAGLTFSGTYRSPQPPSPGGCRCRQPSCLTFPANSLTTFLASSGKSNCHLVLQAVRREIVDSLFALDAPLSSRTCANTYAEAERSLPADAIMRWAALQTAHLWSKKLIPYRSPVPAMYGCIPISAGRRIWFSECLTVGNIPCLCYLWHDNELNICLLGCDLFWGLQV
jgi:hypothetical protein